MKSGTSTKITQKNGVGVEKQPAAKRLAPLHKGTKANKSVLIMQSNMALKISRPLRNPKKIQTSSPFSTPPYSSKSKAQHIAPQSNLPSTCLFLPAQPYSVPHSTTNKIINQVHFLNLDHCNTSTNYTPCRFAVASYWLRCANHAGYSAKHLTRI